MPRETENTGFIFFVLYIRDKETRAGGMYNMTLEARNPYTVHITLMKTYLEYDITLVNWLFLTEEEYNNIKRNTNDKSLPWQR